MNTKKIAQPGLNLPEPDLIDRIANALPAEVRADYYRELRHCRSLPENDEMLRILRAMQYLTLLMVRAPARAAAVGEGFEKLFNSALETLQNTLRSGQEYQRKLDQRLSRLPEEIATGISPRDIVYNINESLHQEFVKSTIPQTARALAHSAAQMEKVSAEFKTTASTLGDSYRGVAEVARRSIDDLHSVISAAAATARSAANDLSVDFRQEYRWSLYALSSLALLIGLVLGIMLHWWFASPAP